VSMHPLRRILKEQSHSVTGIRNGCILLIATGILLAVGANLSVYEPSIVSPMKALYQLHLHMEFLQSAPQPLRDRQPTFQFEDESQREKWTEVLEKGEEALPDEMEATPGMRFGIGLHLLHTGDAASALNWFDLENKAYPDPFVRKILLITALQSGETDLIDQWFNHPDYIKETRGSYRFDLGRRRGDWGMMFRNFWIMEAQRIRPDALMMTLLAGGVWSMMLLGLYSGPFQKRMWCLAPAAVALGWISTWPTIFSGIWLDTRFHLSEGDNFLVGLAYFLVSVALREEVLKLLLYTPFLFWTVKNRRDGEALILGALVGLGFAVEENLGYFDPVGSGVMVSRFISANILHFTLTGAAALALTRAVREPSKWGADSLQIIGAAIGLHAIYNTLLTHPVPGLGDLSYFHGTALVGCCFLFFRESVRLFPIRSKVLSLTAVFCWGFCLLVNLELIHAAARFPLPMALTLSGGSAIASVLSGYVFLYLMREPLSP